MEDALKHAAQAIRLVAFDVDGVLTDGTIYLLPDGSELKAFNTLDGHGMKMLMRAGIQVAIISGRGGPALESRVKTLGIPYLYQGREDKLAALDELLAQLSLTYAQTAHLGDDLPDLPVIRRVALGAAVANAHPFVRQHACMITDANGGQGAVREFCEFILTAQGVLKTMQDQYL